MGGANFARESAGFFFERADSEFWTICAVPQIFTDPLLETAGALALRDVDQIVQNQFAIVPCVYANNQSVTKTHAPGVFGDDADSLRGFGQSRILRQWNAVDGQHPNAGGVLHAREFGVGQMPRAQWVAVFQNKFFLRFRPLNSEWK